MGRRTGVAFIDAEVLWLGRCYRFVFVLLLWIIGCNLARVINDGQPSLTAFTAAAARAAHLIVDDEPLLFADTLAEAMLGDRADELIGYHRAHGTHPVLAAARAQVTCRSRYTEDSLAPRGGRGVSPDVVGGGGRDSWAGPCPRARPVRGLE
jgi:hypothetical protein